MQKFATPSVFNNMIKNILVSLFLLVSLSGVSIGQDYIAAIMERNVFSPDRGQLKKRKAEAEIEELDDLGLVLDGTIIFQNRKFALITESHDQITDSRRPRKRNEKRISSRSNMETHTVELGDTIGSYKVTVILRDEVFLESGAQLIKLELYSGSKTDRGGSKTVLQSKSKRGKTKNRIKKIDSKRNKPKNVKRSPKVKKTTNPRKAKFKMRF